MSNMMNYKKIWFPIWIWLSDPAPPSRPPPPSIKLAAYCQIILHQTAVALTPEGKFD